MNGYPTPEWQLEPGGLWVIFTFLREQAHQPAEQTGQAPDKRRISTRQVESWTLEVLQACRRTNLIRNQIQTTTGIRHRETFQKSYLSQLLDSGWLERTLPDKPTSPKQQYRITNARLRLLEGGHGNESTN